MTILDVRLQKGSYTASRGMADVPRTRTLETLSRFDFPHQSEREGERERERGRERESERERESDSETFPSLVTLSEGGVHTPLRCSTGEERPRGCQALYTGRALCTGTLLTMKEEG